MDDAATLPDTFIEEVERTKRWLQSLKETSPRKANVLRQMVRLRVMMNLDCSEEHIDAVLSDPRHPERPEMLALFLRYLIRERQERS